MKCPPPEDSANKLQDVRLARVYEVPAARGRRPMDAQDRVAVPMLLVVKPDTVDVDLGHEANSLPVPSAGQASLE
jgi:hypothetical protein